MDKNKRKREEKEEEEWGSSLQSYRDKIENQDQKKRKREDEEEEEEWGSSLQSYIDKIKNKNQDFEVVLMEDTGDEEKNVRNSILEPPDRGEEVEIVSTMMEKEKKFIQDDLGIMSFFDLSLHIRVYVVIAQFLGFRYMTQIQARCIPHLLEKKDVVGVSRPGSGKTLAFLIPAIQRIYNSLDFDDAHEGTRVIILCPTTVLAIQIYDLASKLLEYSHVGHALDGASRRREAARLSRGVHLLIATPVRLLYHLRRTKGFVYANLKFLIVDEADRLLQPIFQEEMKQIMELLPKERQTALFSATPPTKHALARVSFKNTPLYIDVDECRSLSTSEGLQQGYCIVPSEMRFCLLYAFLKRNLSKKVVVLFSSCAAVMYYSKLLRCIHVDCFGIHGKQNLQKQASSLKHFRYKKEGVLLCTGVAACGLDFFEVDWVVQYDPSDDSKEYIRKVGLTARGEGGKGDALLFLTPEEFPIIQYLMDSNISLKEYKFDRKKLANLQPHLNYLVEKKNLKKLAEKAYKSYIKAYESYSKKYIFNVKLLSPRSVAASFCLDHPPKINYST